MTQSTKCHPSAGLAERARGGWRREKPDVRTPPVFPDNGTDLFAPGDDNDEEEYDYDHGSSARLYNAPQWHEGPGSGCVTTTMRCCAAIKCDHVMLGREVHGS